MKKRYVIEWDDLNTIIREARTGDQQVMTLTEAKKRVQKHFARRREIYGMAANQVRYVTKDELQPKPFPLPYQFDPLQDFDQFHRLAIKRVQSDGTPITDWGTGQRVGKWIYYGETFDGKFVELGESPPDYSYVMGMRALTGLRNRWVRERIS